MYWLKNGGILMYFILAMSILGLFVVIERAIYFKFQEKDNFNKINPELRQLIEKGAIKEAIVLLNTKRSSTAKVLKDILIQLYKSNNRDPIALEEKGKESAMAQIPLLEKHMWMLSLTAHITPLLGLLGTVTGMIKAFQAVSIHGTGDASVLAKGISEALFTTAGGLFVAIPATIFYNYFNKKIDEKINDMEKTSTELINYFRR